MISNLGNWVSFSVNFMHENKLNLLEEKKQLNTLINCMNVGIIHVKKCNTKTNKQKQFDDDGGDDGVIFEGDDCARNNNNNNCLCLSVCVCEMHRLRVWQKIDR